jgi:hypothetical protein
MSGMVWDELQRLRAAVDAVAEDIGYELHTRPVERLKEAATALEAAIAEAWPPEAVGTPVRTASAVPMELAARALDNATFQFLSHLELPMEELAGLAAAGAMPAPEPLVISDEKAKEIEELMAREHARPTSQISRERPIHEIMAHVFAQRRAKAEADADQWREDNGMRPRQPGEQFMRVGDSLAPHVLIGRPRREAAIAEERPDLLPGVLATTAAQDDARPESPYKPDLSDLVGWFNPDKVRASLAAAAAQDGAEPPVFTSHRRCVDVDLGSLEAPDRFADAFERIVAPAIQALLDSARADRLTLLRLKVRHPNERHDGRQFMRLDFDCGDATPP